METLTKIWHFPLVELAGGGSLTIGQVVLSVLTVLVGWYLSHRVVRIIGRRLNKLRMREDASQTVQRVVFYVLLLVVVATALSMLHVPLTAFAFLSGAVAIGVGFGAQNIINNFISGWILMSERPVRIGDFIEVGGTQGIVEYIGNRSTRIRRVDGVHLLVPNSQILEQPVTNWTLIDRDIRTRVRVGVAYGSPVREVERLVKQAADEHPGVKRAPEPLVIFDDFGDNALVFDLYFWCEANAEGDLRKVRSDIRFRVEELLSEAGITIAFPQRDVHMHQQVPLQVRLLDDNSGKQELRR